MPKCSQCGTAMELTKPEESDIWFVDEDVDIPSGGARVYICAKCQTLEAES